MRTVGRISGLAHREREVLRRCRYIIGLRSTSVHGSVAEWLGRWT